MTINEKDDTKIDGEPSEGLEDLVKDGEKVDATPKDDDEKGDKDGDEDTDVDGGEDDDSAVSELNARFEALETKLDEKDAEITFLRGEIKKRGTDTTSTKADAADEFNIDEIAKQLSVADGGKSAAKAILELANKIADKRLKSVRDETNTAISTSQQIREAKETDRTNVLNEFGEYLDDKDFADTMSEIFTRTNRAAGRYIPDSLYTAAATAKLMIDKKRAAKNGTKNGVKKVGATAPKNPVDNDTHDYSKVKTIDGLGELATPREKAAMKGALAKMPGVTEKQYVENWLEENS